MAIKFLQVNVQHKYVANALLMKFLVDKKIDVALVPEPYLSRKNWPSPFNTA